MNLRIRRGQAFIGAVLTATVVLGFETAAAHPQDPNAGNEHAAQDLVGVPMAVVERESRANASKIRQASGAAPGGRTSRQRIANDAASVAAAADPGQGGTWSTVKASPVVPVFQVVLPNGKVLLWDSVGDNAASSYPDHTFTRAAVWDPRTDTYRQRNLSGYNIFCAGYVQLADGRVLIAGGNKNAAYDGIVQTHTFDWRTETWSRGPNMSAARWYPSVAALGNGEALILGGGSATAEVYQSNRTLRRLTGFRSFANKDYYPFLVPRPNGQVELVGPDNRMDTMRTSGAGALTATRNRDGIHRTYGSFATYGIGKVLVAGGGNVTEGGQSSVPTRTAAVVDVSASPTTVRFTNPMSVGRRLYNLTVLADGSVLATGGQSRSDDGYVDLDNPVFAAERWDPGTEAWTVLSSASRVRQYHSVAALLPDGRVMTGGGGICADCMRSGYLEKNIEYFSPPYLYQKDGSGALAVRPVIDSAPSAVGYAKRLTIYSRQTASISKVGLVRLGAPTHGDDQGQRYVPLSFTSAGSFLRATSPASANIAPPGYYMLFITDRAGVPSVARIVKLDSALNTAPATRSDYNGDGKTDLAVWRPSTGEWDVRGVGTTIWGESTDTPVPGDYNGDGETDLAVWRPSTGQWLIRGMSPTTWGVSTDIPVPADYNGDGKTDVAVWRPSTGEWWLRGIAKIGWGFPADRPVPADYNGDRKADVAVWRPSTGEWWIRSVTRLGWGFPADHPVPGDYNGDRKSDIAVWRPSTGEWWLRGIGTIVHGQNGDIPV